MQKIIDALIILIGLLFYLGCDNQVSNKAFHNDLKDPRISDSLFQILMDDSRLICMEYMQENNLEENNNITLPIQYVKPVLIALQSLYLSDEKTPKKIQKLAIHAFCHEQIHNVLIKGDPKSPVFKAWINNSSTQDTHLDKLIKTYKLTLKPKTYSDRWMEVSTPKGINTRALSRQLQQNKAIESASPTSCIGDGPFIKLKDINFSFLDFTFSYGWGDCPSGCIHRHTWELRIFSNGKWELLREWGDPLESHNSPTTITVLSKIR